MAELFLHPSITSRISDESQIFQTAQGLTMLFAPLFCERGQDGVLVRNNGVSEYLEKHGEPDSVEYGQMPFNVIQWVKAGGEAVTMRLLPDDATFAHSVIDIQTKDTVVKVWKELVEGTLIDVERKLDTATGEYVFVLPSDGTVLTTEAELVAAPNVSQEEETRVIVRPKTREIVTGATTVSAIEAAVDALNGDIKEDGFTHNPLGYFYPIGRGHHFYNDLQFRFSINDVYDDTYDFKVYSVELYEKGTTGSLTLLEGPFNVSLDSTAKDTSGESMFITDVLEKYATEIRFVMNEDVFEELGETLNPEVDPAIQDFLFLSGRTINSEDVQYHTKNIPSTSITIISEDVSAGSSYVFVDAPEDIYPSASILLNGVERVVVSDVDVTTGKLSLESALVNSYEVGQVIAQEPLPEYRQSGVSTIVDSILEVTDAGTEQSPKFFIGKAVAIDSVGVETIVSIIDVDVEADVVTLADAVPADSVVLRQYSGILIDGSEDINFDENVVLTGGSEGSLNEAGVRDKLLVEAYTGITNEDILLKREWPFDIILDANYSSTVKKACNELASVIRQDLMFNADLGFTANPEQAITYRKELGFSNFYTAVWSQDNTIQDIYGGREMKVTPTYHLAGKIPSVDIAKGIHYPFVGPRRGVITADNLAWNPNDAWQERLYRAQVNYIKRDTKRTMLFSQLTSQTVNSALSDISHVRTLLRLQREVEILMEDYQFEFITKNTLTTMNYNLDNYLADWRNSEAFESIKGTVYASDYDKKQKLVRVRIEMVFTSILERVVITLAVK